MAASSLSPSAVGGSSPPPPASVPPPLSAPPPDASPPLSPVTLAPAASPPPSSPAPVSLPSPSPPVSLSSPPPATSPPASTLSPPPPLQPTSPPNAPPPSLSPPPSSPSSNAAAPPPAEPPPVIPRPAAKPPKHSSSQKPPPPPPTSSGATPAVESPPPTGSPPVQPSATPPSSAPSTAAVLPPPRSHGPSSTPLHSPASADANSSSLNSTTSSVSSPSGSPLAAIAIDPGNPRLPRNSNLTNYGTSRGDRGSTSSSTGRNSNAIAAASVVVGVLLLSLVGAVFWYVRKRRLAKVGYKAGFVTPTPSPLGSPHALGYSPDDAHQRSSIVPPAYASYSGSSGTHGYKGSMSEISVGNSKFFTYDELFEITDGFSNQNLLGEGGFGSVYKGCLSDGREVAVKQLKFGGGQGEREFQAEVEIISRVHHRHLVSLVGYCVADHQRLLVYDYVPNNTLHFHLHGQGRPVLEWPIRVRIASGAARGIAYLHEDCHPRIIHRDIKSSNILLDDNFEAQVADFGLARLALDAATHVTTRVMGTFGYLAPEYASTGKLTERSDVYSYGVVLLELITGRKPVDASRTYGDESLLEWARPLLSQALETRNFEDLVDPRLGKNYDEIEMFRMIEAAAACVRHSASRRPRMSQVVRVLDSLVDVDLSNGIQPGRSEMFNVANTADIRMFQRLAFGGQDDSLDFSQSSWNSRRDNNDPSSLPSLL